MKTRLMAVVCVSFICTNVVKAQEFYNKNSVSLNVNILDFSAKNPLQLGLDSLKAPIWGFGYHQYVNNSFDLNYSFAGGNLSGFKLEDSYYYKSFIYKANFDLRYKFNNGYMLKENALVSPFISTGYGYNKFKQVQDGYTNEFRANTYSLGTGFRLNSRGKLSMEYQSSYHKNFDNAATNHFQHTLGLNYGINGKNNQKQAPQFIDPFENANITLIPVEKDIVAIEATIAAPIVTTTLPITESNIAVEVVAHKPIEKEYFLVLGAYGLPETASNAKQKALNIDKNAQIINFKHIYRIAIPVGNDSIASITRLNHVKKMYPDAWILGQTKANTEVVLAQTETKSNATNSNTTSASKEEETKTNVSKMEYMHISADEQDAPKGYYVIVASFAEERFALNYMNNVKKTNPNVIRITSNKTIRIGYFVGSNEQKAEMKLTEIRQQLLPSSWMLVNE